MCKFLPDHDQGRVKVCVRVCVCLKAAADTGSLWQCKSPPVYSAGTQRWACPLACSSSIPA